MGGYMNSVTLSFRFLMCLNILMKVKIYFNKSQNLSMTMLWFACTGSKESFSGADSYSGDLRKRHLHWLFLFSDLSFLPPSNLILFLTPLLHRTCKLRSCLIFMSTKQMDSSLSTYCLNF